MNADAALWCLSRRIGGSARRLWLLMLPVRSRDEDAELKRLRCAPRGGVRVPLCTHALEGRTEYPAETVSVVAHHRQAAALLRPLWCEGGDDGVGTGFEERREPGDVGRTVGIFDKEMERRPVVPDVIGLQRSQLVTSATIHWMRSALAPIRVLAEAKQGCCGQVQHRDILKALVQQAIGQT